MTERGFVTAGEMVVDYLERVLETDPVKIIEAEVRMAEDRLMRKRRKLQAEPREPIRRQELRAAEVELETLRRIEGRLRRVAA